MPPQKKQDKTWLTVWLLTPVVLVGALYFVFPKDAAHSLANRARSKQLAAGEAVGGAKVTADKLAQGLVIRVHDLSGRSAAEGPVYMRTSRQAELYVLTQEKDGWWEITLPFVSSDTALTYSFVLGPNHLPALDEYGHPESTHTPPLVNPSDYAGSTHRPVAEHAVKAWLEAAVKPVP